jgi:hypothetical protein
VSWWAFRLSGVQEWLRQSSTPEFKDVSAVQDTIARGGRRRAAGDRLAKCRRSARARRHHEPRRHTLYLHGAIRGIRRRPRTSSRPCTSRGRRGQERTTPGSLAGGARRCGDADVSLWNNEAIWAHSMVGGEPGTDDRLERPPKPTPRWVSPHGHVNRYASAEREFRTAITGRRTFADRALNGWGQVSVLTGRFDEAIAAGRRSAENSGSESRVVGRRCSYPTPRQENSTARRPC